MGAFSDLLAADAGRRTGPICLVRQFALTLEDDERAELVAALADNSVPGSRIYRALRQMGYTGAEGSVTRHKYGRCACDQLPAL